VASNGAHCTGTDRRGRRIPHLAGLPDTSDVHVHKPGVEVRPDQCPWGFFGSQGTRDTFAGSDVFVSARESQPCFHQTRPQIARPADPPDFGTLRRQSHRPRPIDTVWPIGSATPIVKCPTKGWGFHTAVTALDDPETAALIPVRTPSETRCLRLSGRPRSGYLEPLRCPVAQRRRSEIQPRPGC
jgi:hypothetical protein